MEILPRCSQRVQQLLVGPYYSVDVHEFPGQDLCEVPGKGRGASLRSQESPCLPFLRPSWRSHEDPALLKICLCMCVCIYFVYIYVYMFINVCLCM